MNISCKTTLLLTLAVFFLFLSCKENNPASPEIQADLKDIQERGKLVAITGYSSTSYFVYKGQPMGYEYELLERLADHLGVELEIIVATDLDHIFDMLIRGEGDIIAYGMTITKERKERVAFTEPHNNFEQVLVQRKPDNWRQMKVHEIEAGLIRNPVDLIGKKVHVKKGTSYYERLLNLSEEIGGDINIIPVPGDFSTDQMIKRVADGEVDYTISDKHIAMINQTYYSNIDIETAVSFPQRLAWAVRKSSPELLKAVNEWLQEMKKTPDYNVIFSKYFKNRRAFYTRLNSEYFSNTGGKISIYDSLIKVKAAELGWDWRLLASQIYQESKFDPQAESWMGAAGLMQLIPETAERFGTENPYDPVQNMNAGVAYIKELQKRWKDIPDSVQRIKFILASYNVGEGHVYDARRLAEKYGKDPDIWNHNVEVYMRKKSQPEFYQDEASRHGYCRGEEPCTYVKQIFERYRHYRKVY